jgi:hypothetical protein
MWNRVLEAGDVADLGKGQRDPAGVGEPVEAPVGIEYHGHGGRAFGDAPAPRHHVVLNGAFELDARKAGRGEAGDDLAGVLGGLLGEGLPGRPHVGRPVRLTGTGPSHSGVYAPSVTGIRYRVSRSTGEDHSQKGPQCLGIA